MQITSYSLELDGGRNVLVKENVVEYKGSSHIHFQSPELIAEMANDILGLNRKAEEHLYVFAMDRQCHLFACFFLGKGTVDCLITSPREIFIRLLLCGASCFVMVHNHPSGDVEPSEADCKITERIKTAADIINVELLDHIIVGNGYYSFKDNGTML